MNTPYRAYIENGIQNVRVMTRRTNFSGLSFGGNHQERTNLPGLHTSGDKLPGVSVHNHSTLAGYPVPKLQVPYHYANLVRS